MCIGYRHVSGECRYAVDSKKPGEDEVRRDTGHEDKRTIEIYVEETWH